MVQANSDVTRPPAKATPMQFDHEKFKRLVHYIVWKAGNRQGFCATKLNKVLGFADARAYVLTGRPITGAIYIARALGQAPSSIGDWSS
jgi:hypothetical protein